MAHATNRASLDALTPLLYDELRKLAGAYLRRERQDHTWQSTALVHEAYMKLIDQKNVQWQNRAHFFGVAAQMIRRILVDHARTHQAAKRGAARPSFRSTRRSASPGSNAMSIWWRSTTPWVNWSSWIPSRAG